MLLIQLGASEMAHDATSFLHRYTRKVALTLELISASKKRDEKDSVYTPTRLEISNDILTGKSLPFIGLQCSFLVVFFIIICKLHVIIALLCG